jgi:hypothetical protein
VILSSKTNYGPLKHVGHFLDHLLALLSPLGLAALVGVAAVWAIEKAPTQTFINTASVMTARIGSELNIPIPVIVRTEAKRAVYRMWLTDEQGISVYQFPDQIVDGPSTIDLTNKNIRVPAELRQGTYVLHVQIIYTFNPFKNGNIFMTVATLNVTR